MHTHSRFFFVVFFIPNSLLGSSIYLLMQNRIKREKEKREFCVCSVLAVYIYIYSERPVKARKKVSKGCMQVGGRVGSRPPLAKNDVKAGGTNPLSLYYMLAAWAFYILRTHEDGPLVKKTERERILYSIVYQLCMYVYQYFITSNID